MRPSKVHLVTSCQQLLALGAVLAVLTPAASVISLDVVQRQTLLPSDCAESFTDSSPCVDHALAPSPGLWNEESV